ncbi:hypothetical protein [Streptomyces sp. RKAG293]|uniref:hypothetical protein n=1 Tax=Streptomyces sp. RKAG293 TaxID=2893403 RepID=UPI0020349A88|nr:hypothetical protein [Streptomyces sp. RKAG293]MCM2421725.1 hypothetical protein [Streptomyces sp. RKAG293]
MGDPLHAVTTPHFDVVFMLGGGDDPETVANVDAEVTLRDGSRWSATFLTMEEIARILERWSITGESLGGRYFHCPDLVIIRDPGVPAMVGVLREIFDKGELPLLLSKLE